MNLTRTLQKAIDYMEDNIHEDINYKDVSKHVYMSVFEFHRTFTIIAGISANEYIKKRRLSIAGYEMVHGNRKVIDVALDCGYSSPESFSKAFSKFHGISPREARKSGSSVKVFSRLQIKIVLKGGNSMDYRIEKTEGLDFVAKVRTFDITKTNEDGDTSIPDFWKSEMDDGIFKRMKQFSNNGDVYGICSSLGEDSSLFDYGLAMTYQGGNLTDEYIKWHIEPCTWVVFKCKGQTPDCIGDTWEMIESEFFPGTDYKRLNSADFEYYPETGEDNVFCEIWIPIED